MVARETTTGIDTDVPFVRLSRVVGQYLGLHPQVGNRYAGGHSQEPDLTAAKFGDGRVLRYRVTSRDYRDIWIHPHDAGEYVLRVAAWRRAILAISEERYQEILAHLHLPLSEQD